VVVLPRFVTPVFLTVFLTLLGACAGAPPPFEGVVRVPTGYAFYSARLERRPRVVPLGRSWPDPSAPDQTTLGRTTPGQSAPERPVPLAAWLADHDALAENTPDGRTLRIRLANDAADDQSHGQTNRQPRAPHRRYALARPLGDAVRVDLFEGATDLEPLDNRYHLVHYGQALRGIWDGHARAFLPVRPPPSVGGVAVLAGGVVVTMSDARALQFWGPSGQPLEAPGAMAGWRIGSISGLLNGRLVMLTTPPLANDPGVVPDATWAWAPGGEPVRLWRGTSVMRIGGGDRQLVSNGTRVRRVEIDRDGAVRVTTMRGVRSVRTSPDGRAIALRMGVYDPGFKAPILRETYWNLYELAGDHARPLARGLRLEGPGGVWLDPDAFGGPVEVEVVPRPDARAHSIASPVGEATTRTPAGEATRSPSPEHLLQVAHRQPHRRRPAVRAARAAFDLLAEF
jgi:hypothetical protein